MSRAREPIYCLVSCRDCLIENLSDRVKETKTGLTLRDVADRWATERLAQFLIGSEGLVSEVVENSFLTGTFAGSETLLFI